MNTVRRAASPSTRRSTRRLQKVGLEAIRSTLPYHEDPSAALVSIDPRNGQIRAMVSSSHYDKSQVQPRRPGPPPARLDLQDVRADDGDQAGDRPLLDLLRVETARLEPAALGALGSHTADEGYLGTGQPRAGDGRLRQHRLRPARPRRRARRASPRRRTSLGIVSPLDGIPAEGIGGLRVGVSPLEMVERVRDAGGGRHPPRPDRDPPRRLPRRQGRATPEAANRGGSSPKRSPTR